MGKESQKGFFLAVVLVLGAMLFSFYLSPSNVGTTNNVVTGMQVGEGGSSGICYCPLKDSHPGATDIVDFCEYADFPSCDLRGCYGWVTIDFEDPSDPPLSYYHYEECEECSCSNGESYSYTENTALHGQPPIIATINCIKTGGGCFEEGGKCSGTCVYECKYGPPYSPTPWTETEECE